MPLFESMNVLITGCCGFIGSSFVRKLNGNFAGLDLRKFDGDGLKFYRGDIRDSNLLDMIFEENKTDIVVHLAAKAGVRSSILNPQDYISVNIGGTVNILEGMRRHGVKKIVFASSSSVYGNITQMPFLENLYDLAPISPYACTKKSCEELIRVYSDLYGINAVCLRFFTVYGPRQREDLAINKFTHAILNDEEITMFGDGSTFRDYTYIDDAVNALEKALLYNDTPFEIINIGSGRPVKLIDVISQIEAVIGKKAKIRQLPVPPEDVTGTYADISKAESLLGYTPKMNFEEGLRSYIQSIKKLSL